MELRCKMNHLKKTLFLYIDLRLVRLYLLLLLGLCSISIAFFTYFHVPKIIINKFEDVLTIANSSRSKTYPAWSGGLSSFQTKFYIFNISNIDEVLKNNKVPHLEQKGPYVFEERSQKVDIKWNRDGTVSYRYIKKTIFLPDSSNGTLDDPIYQINLPLVSMSEALKRKYKNNLMSMIANRFLRYTESQLYPVHSVRELLFEGYEDSLTRTYQMLNFAFPDARFGYLYKNNNTISENLLRMYTGQGDLSKLGLVHSINGQKSMPVWGGEKSTCGSFDGVTAGEFIPPSHALDGDKAADYIKIYISALCRHFRLDKVREVERHGLLATRYAVQRDLFDYSRQENKCYCRNGRCPPNGITDLSSCFKGAPLAVSLPHFLYGDEKLRNTVVGMNPDPKLHDSYVDFVSEFGFPIHISPRIQLNVIVEKNDRFRVLKNMTQPVMYIPVMWLEINTNMKLESATLLHLQYAQQHKLYVNSAATVFILAGLALTIIFLVCALRRNYIRAPTSSETNSLNGDFESSTSDEI